jgi:hypothetical protein
MGKFYKLDEASLNRAYQHVVDKKSKSWGMITAFRYANTKKQNLQLNHQLGQDIREIGLGFFKVEGHWRECQDANIPYDKCPKDKLQDSTEVTYFVPNISKKDIAALGKKYEQDAVVYGGDDTNGKAHLIFKDGGEVNVGTFKADKVEQAYTKFKGGHTFVFNKERKPKSTQSATKLSKLIPSTALDKRIKNPDTGRMIKIKSALGYSPDTKVHQIAKTAVEK